jgi:hypothetical protein
MKTINGIEVYEEDNVWYVKYVEDGVEKVSESFTTEENAVDFSLNLKFI